MAGTDKHFVDHNFLKGMDPTRVDENGNRMSEAVKVCAFLMRSDRQTGGDYKHRRQTADQLKIVSRLYKVSNYDSTNVEVQAIKIPFKNTTFEATNGWEKGTKNGISEMFHMRANWASKGYTAMVRHIACACPSCTETLEKEWIVEKNASEQPCYAKPPACVFAPMMMDGDDDLNKWYFVELSPVDGKGVDEDLEEFFTSVMAQRTKVVESEIRVGQIGALSSDTDRKTTAST